MEIKGTIVKRDDDKFLVYGWASVKSTQAFTGIFFFVSKVSGVKKD